MQTENTVVTQTETSDTTQNETVAEQQTQTAAIPQTEQADAALSTKQASAALSTKNIKNQEIVDDAHLEGTIHISEDVIVELVRKTIQGIANIQTAARLASKFGLSRKGGDGIKVSVENGKEPSIFVDVYVLVRYGKRIPDLAWDVQEKVKANLERYTGYTVKAVNINVQGIYIDEHEPVSLNVENV